MDVATILFTYNRSAHTKKVLEALQKNTVLPQKLYIFQDGLKTEGHREEWEKVNALIQEVDFCPVEVKVSDKNKGLAESVVSGINYVFAENDAVIVLEDDCVPAVDFITFMQQCFEKYRDDRKVYSVSGLAWPMALQKDKYDIYGCGRISSWGWGTWKDRWEGYSRDKQFLERIKQDKDKSRNLAVWGNDCEQMLLGTIAGTLDSWAVYWTLHVIENRGICISPYQSLIRNIGLDGTGVHCGSNEKFEMVLSNEKKGKFILPDRINILPATEEAFAEIHGSYTAVNKEDSAKEDVLIYGLGSFFYRYERVVNADYNIKAFIDRKKKGWYAGKKIIWLDEMAGYAYSKIIIMIQDIQECTYITKDLLDRGVADKFIVRGIDLYEGRK